MQQEIALSEIVVDAERIRREFVNVDRLAHSMQTIGLLNPIIITRDKRLVAGERRLRAAKLLKWERIPFLFYDQADPVLLRLAEIEENIRREAMTWQEECTGVALIHNMMCEREGKVKRGRGAEQGGWQLADTADMFSINIGTISEMLQLAKAVNVYPAISQCDSRSTAIRLLRRMQRVALQERLANVQREGSGPLPETERHHFECGDAIDILAALPDACIDLFILDPPWGVDADEGTLPGRVEASNIYADSTESAFEFVEELLPQMARTLKPDRHCYIMFAMEHISRMLLMALKHFDVERVPIVWSTGGASHAPSGKRWPIGYVPILHCSKGLRELQGGQRNVIEVSRVLPGQRVHPHQKPVALYEILLLASSYPDELICDPCCGSGVLAIAAANTNRRSLCIDKEPSIVSIAQSNFLLKARPPEVVKP